MPSPQLQKPRFDLDYEKEAARIIEFVRKQLFDNFRRDGIAIGLSGGLDSSVTAALAVQAAGNDRVLGFILPERESNPLSESYARKLAENLNIRAERVDMTPMLEAMGLYRRRDAFIQKICPEYIAGSRFNITLPQNLLTRNRLNIYFLNVVTPEGKQIKKRLTKKDYLEITAAANLKLRARMMHIYYLAERYNYLVAGTTNRTEFLLGYYGKYGDGGVDIEFITHLFKSQVVGLGRHLGVPDEILQRTPSPDTFSLEVSDKDFYFCLPYDQLDRLLSSWEHKISPDDAALELGITSEEANRVYRDFDVKNRSTWHLRCMPPFLDSE